jgi:hypothetical protein
MIMVTNQVVKRLPDLSGQIVGDNSARLIDAVMVADHHQIVPCRRMAWVKAGLAGSFVGLR